MKSSLPPVVAAGALCWRLIDGAPWILVVHRGRRNDISLPKGKVDAGETLPQTAVREIVEETGLAVTLGAPIGVVQYQLPAGRRKIVHYWCAEVTDEAVAASTFAPHEEIAAVEWLRPADARKKLSYDHDRDIIDHFVDRFAAGRARTFAIIAVRHGKAVPPGDWDGPDSTRPLMHRGLDQAESIAAGIAAFSPKKILSSTASRCLATVQPLSELIQVPIKAKEGISQDAFERGTDTIAKTVANRLAKQVNVVLCSHGPVLPQIIDALAGLTGSPKNATLRHASVLGTGEFTVLHVSREKVASGIVAIETHEPVAAY
ncbi:MAG: NUDIX domain-containing protein [Salinibacterium sp.]|nr:MAG: NUDIX domain-containing protein [Salinibacterium sp.]